jgi:hypothetical protein
MIGLAVFKRRVIAVAVRSVSHNQTAEAPINRFRQGLFAAVTEEVSAFDLPVTGRIRPNFMRGSDDCKHQR